MNSKERLLNAIAHKPVDHVPLYLRLWSMGEGMDNFPFAWQDQFSRVANLTAMGVDDTLLIEPPMGYTEEYIADASDGVDGVEVVRHAPDTAGGKPVLEKTYHTPAGELKHAIKVTDDYPYGLDIRLFNDFNIPRQVKPIINSKEDLACLPYLLGEPGPAALNDFKARAQQVRRQAGRLGVAVDGGWCALGDSAIWLCGIDNVIHWQMKQPELLDELFEVLVEWELRRMDAVLDAGIDVMVHMAWYEGTDFWTPKNYRKLIKPRLKKLVDKAHQRQVPYRYIITKGWKHMRPDLVELGVDCVTGVDPVQDKLDLADVKAEVGEAMCLMGGMNAAVTLSLWSDDEIRQAIDKAMDILAPGSGFILHPVDNIFCELPWEKSEIVISHWKKFW